MAFNTRAQKSPNNPPQNTLKHVQVINPRKKIPGFSSSFSFALSDSVSDFNDFNMSSDADYICVTCSKTVKGKQHYAICFFYIAIRVQSECILSVIMM
jgi:hypothetical protein